MRAHPGTFSEPRADRACQLIENLTHTKDQWAGRPFQLRPWQRAGVREMYGRMSPADPPRRAYRTAFWAIPRKNGKTELAAGFAIEGLLGEGIIGAEVYCAAAEKYQASLVYEAAATMIRNDEELSDRIKLLPSIKRMVDRESMSFCQVLSAEAYSKHGFNASTIIYDELHAAPNRDLYDVLRTSQGTRREPLLIVITTAGYDRTSVCWEMWDYARKVRDGIIDDPTFFPLIYEAAEDADWQDESVWHAANPALGDFRDIEEMRALAREATYKPDLQNTFRRLYLNQWTEQQTAWLDMHRWRACRTADPAEAKALPTYAGLDLGLKSDLSALVGVTPLPDGRVLVRCQFWMPSGAKEQYHGRPYEAWQQAGGLTITPGDVTDFARLRSDVDALCRAWGVVELAYDERFAEPVVQELRMPHVTLVNQPQGFGLNIGLRALADLSVSGDLCHNSQPVLQWMASNAVVEEGRRGDIAVNKRAARDKIDGVVALAMALQRMQLRTQKRKSRYSEPGAKVEAVGGHA